VLLVLAPLASLSLAGQEHGRTIPLTQATAVWEAVQCDERRGEFISHKLGPLVAFMVAKELGGSSLEKPTDDPWRLRVL
jgi:hypothetical protein